MELVIKTISLKRENAQSHLYHVSEGTSVSDKLGSFDHLSGFMSVYFDKGWPEKVYPLSFVDTLKNEIQNLTNVDMKHEHILQRTTVFHELRHFHDCFCTPLGFSILQDFVWGISCLQWLIPEIIGQAELRGVEVTFPLSHYLNDPGFPDVLKDLKIITDGVLSNVALNVVAQPIAWIEGFDRETDFYIVNLKDEREQPFKVPCAISNCMVGKEEYHLLWPIGFALVTETLALLEQEYFINDLDREFALSVRQKLLRDAFQPYTHLIAAFTRVLRKRGVDEVEDDLIFDCLSRTLYVHDRSKPIDGEEKNSDSASALNYCACGWKMLELLERNVEIRNDHAIWEPSALDRKGWVNQIDTIPETAKGTGFELIKYIQNNYLNKALISPEREELKFTRRAGFTLGMIDMPRPPIVCYQTGEFSINDPQFYKLWKAWLVYRTCVETAMFGNVFVCPARDPSLGALFPVNMIKPQYRECTSGIATFNCGIWAPSQEYYGPKCPWTDFMSQLLKPFGGRFSGHESPFSILKDPWKHKIRGN